MKLLNNINVFLIEFFSKEKNRKIKILEDTIYKLEEQNKALGGTLEEFMNSRTEEKVAYEERIKKLEKEKEKLTVEDSEQAEYWNNKWPRNEILYKTQGFQKDVRNIILTKSYMLGRIAQSLKTNSDDETAYKILFYVKNRVKYVGDFETKKVAEFWQDPEETYQTRRGDCEDGALLIASLMRMAGIPSYKVKICAGYVQNPKGRLPEGHAYVIYLRNDNEWVILDWCYFFDNSRMKFRIRHSDDDKYKDIWFTWNDKYSWAQKSTEI